MNVESAPSTDSKPWLPYLFIAVAVIFAHGLALRADFYMDDKAHILTSERIQEGLDAPTNVFRSRHLTFGLWRGLHLVFGDNSVAFHSVNLIRHLGVALLFLPVARRFMRLNASFKESTQETVAFWGTLLFAVHPLVSEPVNYAAQASMLLMMFFATLATYHLLRWHETKRPASLGLMVLAIWLASHAKEPGIFHALIPLILLSVLVVPFAGLREKWKENKRFRLASLIGGGGVGVIFIGGWVLLAYVRLSDTERTFHYALTQSRVIGGYFWRVLVPSDLCSDHHIVWAKSWSYGPALVGLALVIASTLIVLNFACRHRSWFAVLCGLVLFHLYLRFGYSVDELMVEYRMYPSMPWIGLLLALGITRLCELKRSLPPVVRPAAFAALSARYIVTSAAR